MCWYIRRRLSEITFRVCSKDVRSKIGCSFRRRPIPFMVFFFYSFTRYWKVSFCSNVKPTLFWFVACSTSELLKNRIRTRIFFFFFEKTSFPCLVGSELNYIFQLKAQSRIFTRSLLRLYTDIFFLIRKKWAKNMVRWYFLFFQSQKIVTYLPFDYTNCHVRAPCPCAIVSISCLICFKISSLLKETVSRVLSASFVIS